MSGPGEGASSPTPDLKLSEQHRKMLLEESGIDPEVAEARGYRTVEKKAELERLGFGRKQRNVPALLIPVHSPSGEVTLYQSRPDEPRINEDGDPVKYDTPKGSRMTIDVHPSTRDKLGDPSVPLFVTEGIKKGDSLTTRGLCTVTLLGVWSWRGKNEQGGKAILPEWDYVALNGRRVYVVFDSDVMLKPQVHQALSRFKGFLETRGAEVRIVYLPHGEGGKKQGVDDYFVAGHGVDDLLSHATTELREQHAGEDEGLPEVYRATASGIVWNKPTRDGTSPTPLTNFTAEIVFDVVEDDGAEERHTFEIEARSGGCVRRFEVPAAGFASMGWVARHLGASAFVYPGFGYEKHAAVAIQSLSGEITEQKIFTHAGWREIDGEWAYLHARGAIGPMGPLTGVEVAMGEGRLGDLMLPSPPEDEALVEAVRASLRFLDLAPPEVAYPLLAAVYRAPLGEAAPVDLSLHIAGPTGAHKTELTAMAQAHYGAAFDGRNLPGNWESTDNALEKQAFLLKDAVFTVDDFAPTGTTGDVARLHRRADRVIRAQGNRSGRGRMWADGTLRPQYHPRGLVVSSGEDTPRGQSLRARMLVSEASPGDVDLNVLTEMQQAAAEGLLASAMSAYVRYLAPRMGEMKGSLPARQRELRSVVEGTHARTPDVVASLALRLETFLAFATDAGAVTASEAGDIWEAGWGALKQAAAAQAEHQAAEEPTQVFRELLAAAIVGGGAHLADAKTDGKPEDATRWGWRYGYDEWQARGRRIGWLASDGSVLLEPGGAFAAAQRVAREQGTSIPVGNRALWKRMHEKGLLASRDAARGRNTTRATIDGKRRGAKGTKGPFSGEVPHEGAQQGASHDAAHPDLGVQPVRTQAGLQALVEELRGTERVALDLETTGLDPREDRVRIISVTIAQGTWLVDCFEVDPRLLFPVLADKTLVMHNGLFDLGFLAEMGFELGEAGRVIDTMLVSRVLEDKENA